MVNRHGSRNKLNRSNLAQVSEYSDNGAREDGLRNAIRSQMDALGVDIYTVARRADLGHTTPWRFITGRGGINSRTLAALMDVLDLELSPRDRVGGGE